VDSGYPNRPGYLAPYKGTKYHLPEYRDGPEPEGKNEIFNFTHSSLRNVIERAFGVLKMKWRILLGIPAYPPHVQTKIIVACMALYNFIRASGLVDKDFALCDVMRITSHQKRLPISHELLQHRQGRTPKR